MFTGDRFVSVGRGARRTISFDGQTWEQESFGDDPDTYYTITQGENILVAGGGINRYYLSYSEDGGENWTDIPYGGCDGNSIRSMAHHNGIFLAQGQSSCHHNMHRSFDGKTWEPIITLHPFDSYELLGVMNGWFIGQSHHNDISSLYRSTNGEVWDHVYDLPSDVRISQMAAEEWQ